MSTSNSTFGGFTCDSGTLNDLLAGSSLTCPCCNGTLTPDKLASAVRRCAAVGADEG